MEKKKKYKKIMTKIRVCIRKRPPSKKEIEKNDIDILETKSETSLVVKELK